MKNKITTLPLSEAQRNLLLAYESEFDDIDLFRFIAVAMKIDRQYEISLTATQLADLCEVVAYCAVSEENDKKSDKLHDFCDYLEDCLYDIQVAVESKNTPSRPKNTGGVYVFKVELEGNAKIWRKIATRGGQTLDNLHEMIFKAFDRDDEHLYSFYLLHNAVKKRPRRIYDQSTEYTHPYGVEEGDFYGSEKHNAAITPVDSLNLYPGQVLYYLFDFGDEWWHEITVEKTDGIADKDQYPRIIERKGKSPEQYPDYNEN